MQKERGRSSVMNDWIHVTPQSAFRRATSRVSASVRLATDLRPDSEAALYRVSRHSPSRASAVMVSDTLRSRSPASNAATPYLGRRQPLSFARGGRTGQPRQLRRCGCGRRAFSGSPRRGSRRSSPTRLAQKRSRRCSTRPPAMSGRRSAGRQPSRVLSGFCPRTPGMLTAPTCCSRALTIAAAGRAPSASNSPSAFRRSASAVLSASAAALS